MGSCLRRPQFQVRCASPTGAVTVHSIDSETTAADVVRPIRATDPRARALTFAGRALPPDEPLAWAGVTADAELRVVHAAREPVYPPRRVTCTDQHTSADWAQAGEWERACHAREHGERGPIPVPTAVLAAHVLPRLGVGHAARLARADRWSREAVLAAWDDCGRMWLGYYLARFETQRRYDFALVARTGEPRRVVVGYRPGQMWHWVWSGRGPPRERGHEWRGEFPDEHGRRAPAPTRRR